MKKLLLIGLAITTLLSCMKATKGTSDETGTLTPDEVQTADSTEVGDTTEVTSDILPMPDIDISGELRARPQGKRRFTERQLNVMMDTINNRMSEERNNYLLRCTQSWGVYENGIDVHFIFNTPQIRALFRRDILNSPAITFHGPTEPEIMKRIGVTDTIGITLQATKPIFRTTERKVKANLINNSQRTILCGEEVHVAFLDSTGVWRVLPRNTFIDVIGYEVHPGHSMIVTAELSPEAFPSPAGRYRIYYPIEVERGEGFDIMAEFEMK